MFILKRISEVFTEEEFQQLKEVKNRKELSWHDFIMELTKSEER